MSFSSEVKKELLALDSRTKHCRTAELAAMFSGSGELDRKDNEIHAAFITENKQVAQKCVRLLQDTADVQAQVTCAEHIRQKNKLSYIVNITEESQIHRLLLLLKIIGSDGRIRDNMTLTDGLLLQKHCCKRAFLRGAFLTSGSMSDPKKSYHFEIVCGSEEKADQMKEQFDAFGLEAKIVSRKNHEVVYLKEGSQIVDALNIMGAHTALMTLENVRILKEMRNDINRRVNCETANINKTVHAAYRQQEAILFLQQHGALQRLPWQLQEIAGFRMEYPEATIQELGTLCSPKVGKSGVNHRLRKLEETAKQMGYQPDMHPRRGAGCMPDT